MLFCVFCWEGDNNSGGRTFWGLLSVDLELVGEMVEWPVVAVVEELVVMDRGEGVEIVVVEVVEVAEVDIDIDVVVNEVVVEAEAEAWVLSTFLQLPNLSGRQFTHAFPALTQAQPLHMPVLLHLQHTIT